MVTALYGQVGETSSDFTLYGPSHGVLELSRLLDENTEVLSVLLRAGTLDPYPHTGVITELRAEVTTGGQLRIERSGETLRLTGGGAGMRDIARLIRETVQMIGTSPVGEVQLELDPSGGQPLDASSESITIVAYVA